MEFQEENLLQTRIKKRLSIFGLIFGNTIEWSGKLFGYIFVEEELWKVRYLEFDDGWSYMNYWGPWKEEWRFKKFWK